MLGQHCRKSDQEAIHLKKKLVESFFIHHHTYEYTYKQVCIYFITHSNGGPAYEWSGKASLPDQKGSNKM